MNRPILLVEDNASDEKLTLFAFKDFGLSNEVVVVRDGAAALDYLFGTGKQTGRDVAVQPALVLLDLNLPKLDGLDVLRRMRADGRTTLLPVVVLTASERDEDRLGSYSFGANAYVRKPIKFREFVRAANALGLFWLLVSDRTEGAPERELDGLR